MQDKAGKKASIILHNAPTVRIPIQADTQSRNFFAVLCLVELATAARTLEGIVHIKFDRIKEHAERIKKSHPAAWKQQSVQHPLFSAEGKLQHASFPQDTGRIENALRTWLERAGISSGIHDVKRDQDVLRIELASPLSIHLKGFPASTLTPSGSPV
jgi:hypothetical protein